MTEDEAKTKWCPHVAMTVTTITAPIMARATSDLMDAMPEMIKKVGGSNCNGSGCMMWRWAENPRPATDGRNAHPPSSWLGDPGSAGHGYCGLAGHHDIGPYK